MQPLPRRVEHCNVCTGLARRDPLRQVGCCCSPCFAELTLAAASSLSLKPRGNERRGWLAIWQTWVRAPGLWVLLRGGAAEAARPALVQREWKRKSTA